MSTFIRKMQVNLLASAKAVPFPVAMVLVTLALGLGSGIPSHRVIEVFNAGFGSVLGEITLILLPSFILAASITQSGVRAAATGLANAMAPFAGAAMMCPDTAYAALSPVSGRRKLSTLFGVYAGFKLLIPAGPALVAAILGGLSASLILWGAITCLFCWVAGELYARGHEGWAHKRDQGDTGGPPAAVFVPFAVLLGLIVLGALFSVAGLNLPATLSYLFDPKGALLAAAVCGLVFVDAPKRAEAVSSGFRRAVPLLFIIGAAGALGAMMAETLPFDALARYLAATGIATPALFVLAASLKLSKGSSMATFAGAGGIVAAILPGLGLSVEAATLALCAGAFVAIAPNDSLFWLAREDAFAGKTTAAAVRILAIGSTLQGFVALAVVQIAVWWGLL